MIQKICKKCWKEFMVHNYREKTAFYCSISCSKKWQIPSNKIWLKNNCQRCNKQFPVQPAFKDKKFCSYKCLWDSRRWVHKEWSFKKWMTSPRKGKKFPQLSGEKHWNWKWNPMWENHKIRTSLEYKLWRNACYERDNYTCQKTWISGWELCVHHINNFADYPQLRTSIENWITLCKKSHREFHKKYWVKNNTLEQLLEFLNEK